MRLNELHLLFILLWCEHVRKINRYPSLKYGVNLDSFLDGYYESIEE